MKAVRDSRVLELGGYVAAPFAGLLLANLGAEVIKVESLDGDPSRRYRQNGFIASNIGKRSIAVDLKSAAGKGVFARLVASADAVVHNLSNYATGELGLTYEGCRMVKPDIVYCRVTGFGPGPYAHRAATNPIVEALR